MSSDAGVSLWIQLELVFFTHPGPKSPSPQVTRARVEMPQPYNGTLYKPTQRKQAGHAHAAGTKLSKDIDHMQRPGGQVTPGRKPGQRLLCKLPKRMLSTTMTGRRYQLLKSGRGKTDTIRATEHTLIRAYSKDAAAAGSFLSRRPRARRRGSSGFGCYRTFAAAV